MSKEVNTILYNEMELLGRIVYEAAANFYMDGLDDCITELVNTKEAGEDYSSILTFMINKYTEGYIKCNDFGLWKSIK